jgi:oligogalacturonide lyase
MPFVLFLLLAMGTALAAELPPWPPTTDGGHEWVDRDTGHRVVRLSRRENSNEVFYFHQNPFLPSGDKMVFMGHSAAGRCAFTVDLNTYDIRQVTTVNTGFEVVSPKSGRLYYVSGDAVYGADAVTLDTKKVADIPHHYTWGRGLSVNSDETLLAGCYCLGEEKYYTSGLPRKQWIDAIWKAKLPNAIYTIDIRTGKVNEFYRVNEWLGHVQFSPTDPTLIEFSHEGPGHQLDRLWMMRADGTDLRKLHKKQYPRELQTHEFWSPDGARIWCDYQRPGALARALPFFYELTFPEYNIACVDAKTLKVTRYPLARRYASRHFNISPDQTMFCGDGEGGRLHLSPSQKWIFLYRPEGGRLKVEKLCGMEGHHWETGPEPNTHFTPDGKWVVFMSDVTGTIQVYAVSVEK